MADRADLRLDLDFFSSGGHRRNTSRPQARSFYLCSAKARPTQTARTPSKQDPAQRAERETLSLSDHFSQKVKESHVPLVPPGPVSMVSVLSVCCPCGPRLSGTQVERSCWRFTGIAIGSHLKKGEATFLLKWSESERVSRSARSAWSCFDGVRAVRVRRASAEHK